MRKLAFLSRAETWFDLAGFTSSIVKTMEEASGYAHPAYAASLSEFGTPRLLPGSGGWILERSIDGFPYLDAMGCYPLFVCRDWSQLELDLNGLRGDIVSLSLVTDPFGDSDSGFLQRCFKDVVVPFKEHFIADLQSKKDQIVSRHHRYYAHKALEKVAVEKCEDPVLFINDWTSLYATLIRRHNLKGIKAFSRDAFARQLNIPGSFLFRATHDGDTVGAHLWYVQEEVAYSHLAAFSPLGYECMAAYALYWSAIDYFTGKVRWLDLGAGSGTVGGGSDGLAQFKRGWSNGTRTAYFCGRIFDKKQYEKIVSVRSVPATDYFPAYRAGEFS